MSKPWRAGSVAFGLAPRCVLLSRPSAPVMWFRISATRCLARRFRGAPLVQGAMLVPFNWYTVIEIGIAAVVVVLMVLVMSRPPRR